MNSKAKVIIAMSVWFLICYLYSCEKKWVLVVDAGSSGTRVHVYKFKCGKIDSEQFHQVKPGLSQFENVTEAGESLRSLLQLDTFVPLNQKQCTPLMLRATEGLRLLGTRAQNILDEIKKVVKEQPYLKVKNQVEIMDGRKEGVSAWISVNVILNPRKTAAVIDLGGASMQIVFAAKTVGEYASSANLNKERVDLYQHSYSKYGIHQVEERLREQKARCFDSVNLEECREDMMKLFDTSTCSLDPCTFNNVHQPPIPTDIDVHAFSFFHDVLHPLLGDKITRRLVQSKIPNCKLCFELIYIDLVLEHLKFSLDRMIRVSKNHKGFEFGWFPAIAMEGLEQNKC